MAVTFATISGQWVDPTGVPFGISYTKRLRVGYIEPATANGILTSAGKVYFQRTYIDVDASGNASVTLPKVPQVDISPSDPWYKMVVTKLGSRSVNTVTLYFQITADTTWDQVLASSVGNFDPGTSTVAELNDLLANFEALASTVSRDGARRALAPWASALANREAAAAKAVTIGDSITAGTGATTWEKTLPYRLQTILRERHPIAGTLGGDGYVPAAANGVASTGTNSGGTVVGYATAHGLSRQNMQLGSADYFEFPAKFCDRVKIYYGKASSLAGTGTVSIDGVDVVTLDSLGGAREDGFVWDSGALTLGWHTVRVRCAATFVFILEGAEFFNGDNAKGVHVYSGAQFGLKAQDFAESGADMHWEVVEAIQPQLVIVNLGVNDWSASARTPAQFLADIDTILAKIDTVITGLYSVVLVQPYKPSRAAPGTDPDWLAMRAGLLARAVGNVTLWDMDAGWPLLQADGATSAGLMWEGTYPLHPSDLGHEYQAQQYAKLVGLADVGPQPVAAAVQSVVLAADVVNNNASANTIASVTGLGFPVKAGKKYQFRFEIAYDAAATTTGSRWSITGPAGGTMRYRSEYSLTTTTRTLNDGLNAYDTPAASNATSAATGSNIAIVEGFIEPAASGTVTARFASEVSSSAITAKAGSVCYFHEVL